MVHEGYTVRDKIHKMFVKVVLLDFLHDNNGGGISTPLTSCPSNSLDRIEGAGPSSCRS